MKAKGYSLWLMPEGDIYPKGAKLIESIVKRYKTPFFEPHVTLLGEILGDEHEIIEKSEKLASEFKHLTITLESIDYQDYFFRALYVKAQKSDPLLQLHKDAKEIFKMNEVPEYMPHMSLLYGTLSSDEKKHILSSIKIPFTEFTVKRIHLYRTTGEVSSWYKLYEFPFGE